MSELFDSILVQQLMAVVATLLLWQFAYNLFKFITLSDTNWKRLEYIWIFIALLGLMTLINENKKQSIESELSKVRQEIKLDMSLVNFLLSDVQTCTKYKKTESSPENFDLSQYDQNLVCNWSKDFIIETDSITGIPLSTLDLSSLQTLDFKTDFMHRYVKEISLYGNRVNKNIEKNIHYSAEIEKKNWDHLYKSVGVVLLIIAIAIRLALTQRNVINSKFIKEN
jgi:hypothetical protein